MRSLDEQLHGYKQGHQLLSSTIRLAKDDQDLIDRLSDVAGPLGPNERFTPYLTCYPLPAGLHYVVACTWQDLDAPRAGCVRTRSLLIPMPIWEGLENLSDIVAVITQSGAMEPAKKRQLVGNAPTPLPIVDPRQGTELIEALFLEERVPIVVFDAEQPQALALRIITALWPAFRRNFAVSTFCRSPRTITRRSFDLVFAPKEARSQFGDWTGRRVDGRNKDPARHPWSKSIVERVLLSPFPSLKMLDVIGEMSSDGMGSEAALRVSLLWDELQQKVYTSPNAILGLLDIANTRSSRNENVIRSLEPALANSARMVVTTMAPPDAWRFLKTLVTKLEDIHISIAVRKSIASAATELASKQPGAALSALNSFIEISSSYVLEGMGDGLAKSYQSAIGDQLYLLTGHDLLTLTLASSDLMKVAVSAHPKLPGLLANAIAEKGEPLAPEISKVIMPLLSEDAHASLARVLFQSIEKSGIEEHLNYLYKKNGLRSEKMRAELIDCAKALGVTESIRNLVANMEPSVHIDSMLVELLKPNKVDMVWLVSNKNLGHERKSNLLYSVLELATPKEICEIITSEVELKNLLNSLDLNSPNHVALVAAIAREISLPPVVAYRLVTRLLAFVSGDDAIEWTLKAIDLCLQIEVPEASSKKLTTLLNKAGGAINGIRVFRLGLNSSAPPSVVERNFSAFGKCKAEVLSKLFEAIEEMADQLTKRNFFDLTLESSEVAADLLWGSRNSNEKGLIRSAAKLLPYLLENPKPSASRIIAVVFPVVYGELASESSTDLLSTVLSFMAWDKCKEARRSLVYAYMRSNWRIGDIALAATRAGDTFRILETIAKEPGGQKALQGLRLEMESLPAESKRAVAYALQELAEKK